MVKVYARSLIEHPGHPDQKVHAGHNAVTGGSDIVMKRMQDIHGKDNVLTGKGGFFVKGQGHISGSKARKITNVLAPKREKRAKVLPYGDYAWIAAINHRMKG